MAVALQHWSDTVTVISQNPFTATVLGLPRVGPRRELKRATESYWAGRSDAAALHETGRTLRRDQYAELAAAGLDSIPVGTFSYYDQMLDTAVLLGALPARVAGIEDPLDRYFAAARGNESVEPLEMTKWFDTNYHYLVPELDPGTTFTLHPGALLAQVAEAIELGVAARPVVIGPVTFLKLAKSTDGSALDRIGELIPLYRELLGLLAEAGVSWVQLDEPALVTDLTEAELAAVRRVYTELTAPRNRPAVLVATYFGHPGPALDALAGTDIEGIAVDLVAGTDIAAVAAIPALAHKLLVAGVVDGRNVWRTDLDRALSTLATLLGSVRSLAISTSCSLLHVPYSLAAETRLDDALRSWLAFGAEKTTEVRVLATGLNSGTDAVAVELAAA
ncbi:MAG: 5-methyltetrahydropteroyltriglutamate--homocysteine S-methyltransferase, partial [Nocardia sp.]|nr:5-methyltetrahydropteroyltriglutamate--homocysteine S-methyltransferase [Nocardia sp.]